MTPADTPSPWRLCIDTGGTFTDGLAFSPEGTVQRVKVLSNARIRAKVVPASGAETPDGARPIGVRLPSAIDHQVLRGLVAHDGEGRLLGPVIATSASQIAIAAHESVSVPAVGSAIEFRAAAGSPLEAPTLAAHVATGTPVDEPLPPMAMRLATTRGTNALLTGCGARCALLTTAGFEDLLRIGDQRRPRLFDRDIRRPAPIAEMVIGVTERLAADGAVLTALTTAECERLDRRLRALEPPIETVALALLHAWSHPAHERELARFLRERGWRVIAGAELAPRLGFLSRIQTTVAEAFLAPVMHAYLQRVRDSLAGGRLHVLSSAGGLIAAPHFAAVDGLLSGPAGGVVGAHAVAQAMGLDRVISFDMGGTSTDVARLEGRPLHRDRHRVGPFEIVMPSVAIETVAAGGGSICTFDGHRLAVGPHSAGADPGPACYGRGGPLTVTDVNLLLGRLAADRFGIPIDRAAAESVADSMWAEVHPVRSELADRGAMLEALLDLADERMADAIAAVSIRQGVDCGDHALVAFGGAGGLHACRVAERLGIGRVLLPRDAGILSAVGLAGVALERVVTLEPLVPLTCSEHWHAALVDAEAQATALVRADIDGTSAAPVRTVARSVALRVVDQEATIDLALAPGAPPDPLLLRQRFEAEYMRLYGHAPRSNALEVASVRVTAASAEEWGHADLGAPASPSTRSAPAGQASTTRRVRWSGAEHDAAILDHDALVADSRCDGPALILGAHGSAAIPPHWSGVVTAEGTIDLRRALAVRLTSVSAVAGAPTTELIASRLMAVATEMGELLRRTAVSTNVRERLDFSCGILDAAGALVANAPHVPVHLGALGYCVRAVAAVLTPHPGDVIVTNHPAFGGSHLPDVTLLTPVFAPRVDERATSPLLGWVASRAHHAEIGGRRPGSMAPDATTLAEEGVVIVPMRAVDGGASRLDEVEALLRAGPTPSRRPELNIADLRAAIAANAHGARRLTELAKVLGTAPLTTHMALMADHAAARCRAALASLNRRCVEIHEQLDDGTPLCVRIEVVGEGDDITLIVDLRGTGGPHAATLNATPAIVGSVVAYVMRVLVDADVPLNEGLLRPVRILLARSLLDPPFDADPAGCPAVGGGNTEISQRLADALLRALDLTAGSQGTMNSVAFGNAQFSHYETIGGGAGATAACPGADGVHTNMTNTAITDVEILEHRMPVRIRRFGLRRGSGGGGKHRGGDGLVREYEFLEATEISLLTQRRVEGPPGAAGGAAGLVGRQTLVEGAGPPVELPPLAAVEVTPGARLLVETPGGGAWGADESGNACARAESPR